jgi:hypothetical protein
VDEPPAHGEILVFIVNEKPTKRGNINALNNKNYA